jgi:hypothetical protein
MDFHPYGWATGPWELITQSPEQGGGCRCLPKLLHRLWFSLHQLRAGPPQQIARRLSSRFRPLSPSPCRLGCRRDRCRHRMVQRLAHSPLTHSRWSKTATCRVTAPLLSSSHSSPKSQALKNENRMWGCLQTKLRRTATIPFALAAGAGKHVC